ncbi:MAG: peptidase M22 [Eubacterium sp.]|nr:peptidase M22 [Eubacterium sp.]MDE6154964.1 peptidase M22 [Eubacterium sp.]
MYLGFDTSNYTTSVALFDGENMYQSRQLLSVKNGERGLRQSDAVFQHTVNMPILLDNIKCSIKDVKAVAVSTRPRNIDGSYMPCFLVGKSNAVCASSITGAKLYETSHQIGHILAALYSIQRLDLITQRFIAFHVSGGTTEALLVEPDSEEIIKATVIAQSTDLKAGQAIDRAGVMMGYTFPCGKKLDELSQKSNREFNIKPSMIGMDCSLSGIENKAKAMLDKGESNEDISKFVLSSISCTIDKMTEKLLNEYDNIPIIYAGGVMSNTLIKTNIMSKYNNAYFAHPAYSCDNACGIAIYAYLKDKYE